MFSRSISLKSDDDTTTTYLEKSITFGRRTNSQSSSGSKIIELSDNSISRTHCSIMNYNGKHYLTDEGSVNGTFIVVPPKHFLVLKDKMELKIGNDIYKILLRSFNEVELQYSILIGKEFELRSILLDIKDHNEVGMGFSKKELRSRSFIGINDKLLSDTYENHIVFKRDKNYLVVAECLVKVKLVPERLVWLTKRTRFAVSNFEYMVKDLEEKDKDLCLKCRKRANVLTFPCEHSVLCEFCCELNKIDNCPQCDKHINKKLIIDKIKYFK